MYITLMSSISREIFRGSASLRITRELTAALEARITAKLRLGL